MTFIFGRCRRSSAAVTPVKYECDSGNLTGTFAKSKILLTEKLANGALVTPTPGLDYLPPYRQPSTMEACITACSTKRIPLHIFTY